MPVTNACCCLCGDLIIDAAEHPSWMAQFLAVYSLEDDIESETSDTPSANAIDEKKLLHINLLRTSFEHLQIFPVDGDPVIMLQAWAFPFHSACWQILSRSSHPEQLDCQALMSLCRSFPSKQGLLNWGHDYGGLVRSEPMLAPGEEPSLHRLTGSITQGADPFDIPVIHLAFEQAANDSHSHNPILRVARPRDADPFASLPMEILHWILTHLPSRDVVQLKLASRVYGNLVLPNSFWKSRFLPGRELHHIFEAQKYFSSVKGCWKCIFRSLKTLGITPAILNRKRTWGLSSSLHGLLELMKDVNCDGDLVQSFFDPNAQPNDRHWITASRALKKPTKPFFTGSRVLHERELTLPPESRAIFASTVELFGRHYISGIRIVDRDARSFSLGYQHPNHEKLLLEGNSPLHLCGFCLAQDQRGVRGLAIIRDTGAMSSWIGDHHDIPKRRLATTAGRLDVIDSLKGGFDAVKLVSLSVPSNLKTETDPAASPCSRDATLWYPDIPHPALSFLGVSDIKHNADPHQELPVCFQVVGCPNDDHVQQINSITVRTRGSDDGLGDELGAALSILIGSTSIKDTAQLGLRDVNPGIEREFTIDTHGGERITGLDTLSGGGELLEFKQIYTSHNRSGKFHLQDYEDLGPNYRELRSIRTDGKAVVGIWGTVHYKIEVHVILDEEYQDLDL
ncbi:hypothetical protein HJFPF1_10892 [Paramyrothecium foliicola]|nr:hypothetical protein HJFPF1_10892 [Paramyrothecium foliicola]